MISSTATHRRAVAQQCINGDSLSQWTRAKFDPHRMEIPEPIAKKFGTVDYVRKATPCAKFRANQVHGGLLGKCVKYNLNFSEIYLFFQKITYRSDRLMDFHAQWLNNNNKFYLPET